ncbi:pyridoxine kinase [Deinobacterium chartae]|uniref:Pyridoxal kinase PdxY n=1 Tax=Deinobacterium chartae TaxID=521158 RepID=A0A841HXQ1_9DEIO|nr:pyridoxal kinase PdxY [Deinobacterium chartae]MBB6096990.1 pyridoxine kinase [Deinobacterium chartae]
MSVSIPKNVLSIQSWVAYGHAGNASAIFPLQRMGYEVWAVHTVQFSNHTGYGQWRGQVFGPDLVTDLVRGIEERGVLGDCDGVLTGYMGDASIADAMLEAVAKVRAANPRAVYACDPVMGDVGRGVFVRPEIPDVMRERAVTAADVVLPNQFELELLTGRTVTDLASALEAADALRARLHPGGPRIVVVTSLTRSDAPVGTIETLGVNDAGAWVVRTPLIPLDPPRVGTGDVIASLFVGNYLREHDLKASLEGAVSSMYALLERTHASGTREIQLVASQDEFARPSRVFAAERVR